MSYPILFPASATTFASQGLGVLSDAISCEVTEERNGMYELQMQYSITGIHFNEIEQRNIILAKSNYTDDPQPFRIYRITKPLNGICTIYAQHITYDLSGYEMPEGLSASGLTEAVQLLSQYSGAFTVSTTKTGSAIFKTDVPASVRSWFGGKEGSLLDLYGGEWHWDGMSCILSSARGVNRGVTIRYGKNLISLTQEEECENVYTHVRPYYASSDDVAITGGLISTGVTLDSNRILFLDCSAHFNNEPTIAQLDNYAQHYISQNNLSAPHINLELNFVQLQGLSERVDLCDTVTIEFEKLGVSATAKCIKTTWDVLEDRYTSTTFGDVRTSIADTINSITANTTAAIEQTKSILERAIESSTSLITGNAGGYVVIHDGDNDDYPDEILIMDTPDINTAVKVWRWNKNGLGYSSTGYAGTYGTAITANGQIVADFITSGMLNANIIKTGIIQGQQGGSYWNLVTGELHIEGGATVDKSKVFISEPTVPYYEGDLWVTGQYYYSGVVGYAIAGYAIAGDDTIPTGNGQIMACRYTRTTGSYSSDDWELITNYVDTSEIDILNQRITSVEVNVSQQDAKIDAKASSTEVTELGNRITYAELDIDGLSGEISSKVSQTDYNGNTIASLINQNATTVQIQASKINLTGYVTVSALSGSGTTTINGSNITTGSISANRISGGTLTLGGSSNGNGVLNVNNASGSLVARMNNAGLYAIAGTIGGYTIRQYTLTGGSGTNAVGICSTANQGWAFWAGASSGNNAPFHVGHNGALYATNATITGSVTATSGTIGGYTIGSSTLRGGSGSNTVGMCSTSGQEWAFWAGASSGSNAPFHVGHGGDVHCSNLSVTGGSININGTRIDGNGYMYVPNADLAGNFYGGGTFGGSLNYATGSFSGSSSGSFSGTGTLTGNSTLSNYSNSGNVIILSYGSYQNYLAPGGMTVTDGSARTWYGAGSSSSDRKLKKNITTLDRKRTADFVYSLNPVTFMYKEESKGRHHHGFIAQEVQKINPDKKWEIVYSHQFEDTECLMIAYQELIADLVATVQSLNERIKVLEAK